MNNENYIKIGYMDHRYAKSMKMLTAEILKQLLTSEKVRRTMAQIEAEPDMEKKTKLKEKLPVVLYACQMTEEGKRPSKDNGLPVGSGFCLHDWDHMTESPRLFYTKNIAGHEGEWGIVLAHITPRGEGLRLVTTMHEGEQIAQCQARLAAHFGMEQCADPKIKDITRLSFLPSQEYLLYLDEKGLFEQNALPRSGQALLQSDDELPRSGQALPQSDDELPHIGQAHLQDNDTLPRIGQAHLQDNDTLPRIGQAHPQDDDTLPHIGQAHLQDGNALPHDGQADLQAGMPNANPSQQNVAENFAYNGIKYSSIIETLAVA